MIGQLVTCQLNQLLTNYIQALTDSCVRNSRMTSFSYLIQIHFMGEEITNSLPVVGEEITNGLAYLLLVMTAAFGSPVVPDV